MRYRFSGNRRLLVSGWMYDMIDRRRIRRIVRDVQPDVLYLWGITGTCLRVVAELTRRFPTAIYVADYWLSMWLSGERLPDGFAHQIKTLAQRPLTRSRRLNRCVQAFWDPMHRRMYPKWLTSAPFVVHFDSAHMAADVRANGVRLAHERVVPHGIELRRFPYVAPTDRPANGKTLLFVGRVVPVKGIETLLAAMPMIRSELPDSRLTVAGPVEASYAAKLAEFAAGLGIEKAVTMLGPQNQPALVRLYHDHQLLVFPSEWDEPFGIVLVEAMACGLPVLCSAAGGSAEVVDGETTGLRFERGDAGDLASKAVRLLRSAELGDRLAQGARRRVVEEYDIERMVDVIEHDLQAAHRAGM